MVNKNLRNPVYNLLPLLIIIFFDSFAYFLIIPVLLRVFVSSNLILAPTISLATRNLLFSIALMISPLSFLIACPIVGHLSDRYGRKMTMFFCLIASLIGFAIPVVGIIKKQAYLILLGRFIAGASTSSQPIAQAAMADVSTGHKKAFYLSLIGFSMTLAMILGPITGSFFSEQSLGSWFNLTTPYWFGIFLSVVNILLLFVFFHETTEQTQQMLPKYSLNQLFNMLHENKILGLLVVFFLLEFAWSQYYQAIFLFLGQQFHYSTVKIGLFTTYLGIWMSLGLTLFFRIMLRFTSIENIAKISLLITTLGLIGCTFTRIAAAQWIFMIPTAACTGMAYASLLTLISNRTAGAHQGLALGWASTALAGAWMLSGFLAGPLMNIAPSLPIYLASFMILLGLIIYLSKSKGCCVHDST